MNDSPIFEYYVDLNGKCEFEDFLDSLPTKDADKLYSLIMTIQEEGMLTAFRQQWVKRLDSEVFEIRSKISTNIQRALYFHKAEGKYIITHGFTKKTQETPKREIEKAHRIIRKWRDENANQKL
jgi:phage-related protein